MKLALLCSVELIQQLISHVYHLNGVDHPPFGKGGTASGQYLNNVRTPHQILSSQSPPRRSGRVLPPTLHTLWCSTVHNIPKSAFLLEVVNEQALIRIEHQLHKNIKENIHVVLTDKRPQISKYHTQ